MQHPVEAGADQRLTAISLDECQYTHNLNSSSGTSSSVAARTLVCLRRLIEHACQDNSNKLGKTTAVSSLPARISGAQCPPGRDHCVRVCKVKITI